MRRILYLISGDIPPRTSASSIPLRAVSNDLLREPVALPGWLSEEDLDIFAGEFERKATFRHGLNWYRNIDQSWELLTPFVNAALLDFLATV